MKKLGFIGLGIMGKPMAKNLIKGGYDLVVYDLNKKVVDELVQLGAESKSLIEIGQECEVIFTILPNGQIVKDVLFGENGITTKINKDTIVIDMSSVTPTESKYCAEKLEELGVGFLDAPVSGGEPKAIDGTLAFMVGGKEEVYDKALNNKCKENIISLINLMPRGIQTMSMDIKGLVESSTNLGVVSNNEENIVFEFATRSSVKSLKEDLNNRMNILCNQLGVKLDLIDDYPEWEYAKDSKLEEICVQTYEELMGKKPEIVAIHAGLECGLLLDAIKGAQAISIGPNLFDVHTPNEHLDILSTERTWNYLVAILKNIK